MRAAGRRPAHVAVCRAAGSLAAHSPGDYGDGGTGRQAAGCAARNHAAVVWKRPTRARRPTCTLRRAAAGACGKGKPRLRTLRRLADRCARAAQESDDVWCGVLADLVIHKFPVHAGAHHHLCGPSYSTSTHVSDGLRRAALLMHRRAGTHPSFCGMRSSLLRIR